MATIPYKIYLEEDEMPKPWYNLRADMNCLNYMQTGLPNLPNL
ncbi:hypothetical protein [Candidatus Epulonipiscium viviparus]|nr:hypothetical protein [Candidatus Epulopiscium viviparus]